jgi:NitT/TauT family transport system permease protein
VVSAPPAPVPDIADGPGPPRRPLDSSSWTWATRASVLVAGAAAWEGLARALGSLMLPSASATLVALARLAHGGELWQALWTSNQALLLGYLLAAAGGLPLGLLLGRAPRLGAFADVFLDILLFTPMPAVIPLLVMATGLGLQTRLLVVFLFAVAIIAVHAAAGARGVDPEIVEMARAFGAGRVQLCRRVILPGALPAVLVGLRLGLSRGISGMVAVELLLVAVGVGRLIQRFQGDFDAPAVYAVVLVIVAEAVLLTGALRRVERRLALRRANLVFA